MAIEALIARYGLAAIFLGAGVEGETCVIAGGVLAHRHLLPLSAAIAAAAAGSFVADQLFFAGGRYFREHPRVRAMAEQPGFAKALVTLERHPVLFVIGFRFLYGLRTVSPVAIGTSHIRTRIFLPLNALAAAIWGILFTGIGYGFGGGIERLLGGHLSAGHLFPLATGMVVFLIAIAQAVRWLHHRYADRCERRAARGADARA
jgi:membrane protein DedA with SNARE-associated domain